LSGEPLDLETRRLKKALAVFYKLQKRNYPAEEIMPRAMEELKLSEEEAVQLIRDLIARGWLVSRGILTRYFFQPGKIYNFPVIVAAAGLETLQE